MAAISIGHCKDCRWWDQEAIALYGIRDSIKQDRGVCELATLAYEMPDHRNSKAFVSAENIAFGYLLTTPDFGCVQFEKEG